MAAHFFPGGPWSHQRSDFLALFIDVMYADVVLNDRCCRLVGDSFVAEQEPALRALVASAVGMMPDGLRQAISTYCVRHVVLRSPEVMLTSEVVRQALLKLSDHCSRASAASECRDDLLATAAQSIRDDAIALSKKLEVERCAHLIDALGDTIIGYMNLGAAEIRIAAARALDDEAKLQSPFSRQLWPTVTRFITTAAQERETRKRQRETDLIQDGDQLLFEKRQRWLEEDKNATADAPTLTDFPGDIQTAIGAPARPQIVVGQQHHVRVPALTAHLSEKQQVFRRVVAHDSILEGWGALHDRAIDASGTVGSSDVAVDHSDFFSKVVLERQHGSVRETLSRCRATHSVAAVGASEMSVLVMLEERAEGMDDSDALVYEEAHVLASREVITRSYSLCRAKSAFEPTAARGFRGWQPMSGH